MNPFLPLVAECLLQSIDLLARACDLLKRFCVEGMVAEEARCRELTENSTACATALLPVLGYARMSEVARMAAEGGKSVRQIVLERGWLSDHEFDALISPEAVCRLGTAMEAVAP